MATHYLGMVKRFCLSASQSTSHSNSSSNSLINKYLLILSLECEDLEILWTLLTTCSLDSVQADIVCEAIAKQVRGQSKQSVSRKLATVFAK